MPLMEIGFGDITQDYNAILTSITSSVLSYDSMNSKISDSVRSMISSRPHIVAYANDTRNSQVDRNEAVSTYNALWDVNRQNIIDLSVWMERQYSGPNLPPRISGSGNNFSGLADFGILPAIPVGTAAVAVIAGIAVTSAIIYAGKVILTYQKTSQMEQWAKLTPAQRQSYNEGPGGDVGTLANLVKLIPWVVVGGLAFYMLPVLMPKKKAPSA